MTDPAFFPPVPSPAVQTEGQGVVGADQFNTFLSTVANLDQLRTFPGVHNMMCLVQGTNEAGDGGATIYWYDMFNVSMDNNSSVIRPTGTVQGRWIKSGALQFFHQNTLSASPGVFTLTGFPAALTTPGTYTFVLWDTSCHIYSSKNSGSSWTEGVTQSPQGTWIDLEMAINDADYNTVVGFVFSYTGNLFATRVDLSTTLGSTGSWSLLNPTGPTSTETSSHFQNFYAGAISSGASIILALPGNWADSTLSYPRISTNTGASWSDITSPGTGLFWLRAAFGAGATTMYMIASNQSTFGGTLSVFKSTNTGSTWSSVAAPSTTAVSTDSIGLSMLRCSANGNTLLYVSSVDNNFYVSTNGASSWTKVAPPVPGGTNQASFAAFGSSVASCGMSTDGTKMIVCFGDVNGAGSYPYNAYVAISTNSGTTWTIKTPPGVLSSGTTVQAVVCNVSNDGQGMIVGYQNDSLAAYSADISTNGGGSFTNVTNIPSDVIGNNLTQAYVLP